MRFRSPILLGILLMLLLGLMAQLGSSQDKLSPENQSQQSLPCPV